MYKLNLIYMYFFTAPFIWGYITKVSGLQVRPSDLICLALIVATLFSGRIIYFQSQKTLSILLALFVASMAASTIAHGWNFVWLLKIAALAPMPFFVCGLANQYNYEFPAKQAKLPMIVIGICCLPIAAVFAQTISIGLSQNLLSAMYRFWVDVFNINPFGPDGFDGEGLSPRNAFSVGCLSIVIMAQSLMQKSHSRTVLIWLFAFLVVVSFSRTGWVGLSLLFILSNSQNKRRKWVNGLAVGGGIAYIATSRFAALFVDRAGSNFGRAKDYGPALDTFLSNFLTGDPTARNPEGYNIVHNVTLQLGANYGILPFLSSVCITLFCLYWFFKFLKLTVRGQLDTIKLAGFCTAAFIAASVPQISAAGTNLWPLGGWACLSIALAGARYVKSQKGSQSILGETSSLA